MSSKIYSIPIVDDEGFKFNLDQTADSLIAAVLLMHRWLNCQHSVDIEMLELTEQDKKSFLFKRRKNLLNKSFRPFIKLNMLLQIVHGLITFVFRR